MGFTTPSGTPPPTPQGPEATEPTVKYDREYTWVSSATWTKFGMVRALIVVPEKAHIDAVYRALGIA
jgi:hypothetical protein